MSYFAYPATSDTPTACTTPRATANTANCFDSAGGPTDVGSYTGAASPNGTFDQRGNALEWNETMVFSNRIARGGLSLGGIIGSPLTLRALVRHDFLSPTENYDFMGFRVASLVPPVPSLAPIPLGFLGALMGFAAWRRLRR